MSRGKHLSLSEARKTGKLDRTAKEHPMTGDADKFSQLVEAMTAGKKPAKAGTSSHPTS